MAKRLVAHNMYRRTQPRRRVCMCVVGGGGGGGDEGRMTRNTPQLAERLQASQELQELPRPAAAAPPALSRGQDCALLPPRPSCTAPAVSVSWPVACPADQALFSWTRKITCFALLSLCLHSASLTGAHTVGTLACQSAELWQPVTSPHAL